MNILINGKQLGFKLEAEKNAKEIVWAIKSWAAADGRIISSLSVDGKRYELDNEKALEELSVDTILGMDFTVESTRDLIISTISEAVHYSSKVLDFDLKRIDAEQMKNLKDGLQWLHDAFAASRLVMGVDYDTFTFEDRTFSGVLQELSVLGRSLSAEALGKDDSLALKIKETVRFFVIFMEALRQKLFAGTDEPMDVVEQMKTAMEFFDSYAEKSDEIAALLQTGKELEGLEKLSILTAYLESSIRILVNLRTVEGLDLEGRTVGEKPFVEFIADLQSVLKEIIGAFDNKDIVLLGDLIEYEIPEKVDHLNALFKEIAPALVK